MSSFHCRILEVQEEESSEKSPVDLEGSGKDHTFRSILGIRKIK